MFKELTSKHQFEVFIGIWEPVLLDIEEVEITSQNRPPLRCG
jgi:hypothetical protein